PMQTLRSVVAQAHKDKKAVGHFNFSNLEGLYAIARAAKTLNVPVIVGLSEGEQEAVGTHQAVALVKSIREHWNIPIYLNADHHYSFATVKDAIDAGFDAAIYDGAAHSFDENVAISKQCVEYARQVTKETGRDILLEIELGYIGEGSKMRDAIPEGVAVTTSPEEAKRFIAATGADMLAPAVGNFHGMLKVGAKPRLDIDCIKEINSTVNVPLVLHGGSGEDADFEAAIDAGIAVIHVNTELRRAYTAALKAYMDKNPDDIAPYKYGTNASLAMEAVVTEKLKIFNRIH
ncbi:MAG: class II fructose-bisphosphate aldolase, partial [Candidatus Pacebacteria bacterium]|nr:class II fructose-bisphosphate aldolase [Candidatus Paceibacterota bacterium]